MSKEEELFNTIYVGDIDEDVEKGGLGKCFFYKMQQHGDSIAQIDTTTGEEDPFSDYFTRCLRTAIRMRKKGFQRGEIATIFDYNHLNTSVPLMATLFLGGVVAGADPKLTLQETAHLLGQLESKIIFTSPPCEELLMKAAKVAGVETEIVVAGKSKYGNTEFDEFLQPSPNEEAAFKPVEIEDLENTVAIILFSSGSTGLPKGICLNHYPLLLQLKDLSKTVMIPGARFLHFSSIYWITKISFIMLSVLYNFSVLIIPDFDEIKAWDVVTKYRVNVIFMSPNYGLRMLRGQRPLGTDDSSLKLIIVAGNRISEQHMSELRAALPNGVIIQGWAMTETAGRPIAMSLSTIKSTPADKINRALGRAMTGVRYKIVDLQTGKALGPNKPGELRLKSKIQMSGYFKMDSSDAWDENGYLKTGDMMYYDEDLYIYYVERIGETFKYRSDYVYPNLFEEAFLTHPAVKSVVVVGIPHPTDGMRIAAMVSLLKDNTGVNEETLRQYAEKKTGGRIPINGGVMIVDEIPEVTSGKPRRKIVKDMLIEANLHSFKQ